MSRFESIDSEARQLLEEADWHWSGHGFYEKGRDPEKETTEQYRSHPPEQITYEELSDHGIAGQALTTDREAGLQWLRTRLNS